MTYYQESFAQALSDIGGLIQMCEEVMNDTRIPPEMREEWRLQWVSNHEAIANLIDDSFL